MRSCVANFPRRITHLKGQFVRRLNLDLECMRLVEVSAKTKPCETVAQNNLQVFASDQTFFLWTYRLNNYCLRLLRHKSNFIIFLSFCSKDIMPSRLEKFNFSWRTICSTISRQNLWPYAPRLGCANVIFNPHITSTCSAHAAVATKKRARKSWQTACMGHSIQEKHKGLSHVPPSLRILSASLGGPLEFAHWKLTKKICQNRL